MSDSHLSNDVFLSEVTLMFHNARDAGTVGITIKKYDGRTKPFPKRRTGKKGKKNVTVTPEPLPEPEEYKCLIRAKYQNSKIATVVSPADALKFQLNFIQFLRISVDGLKKEKKLRKKAKKATQ